MIRKFFTKTATRSATPPAIKPVAGAIARRKNETLVARAGTVNVAERTFECTASTETPVRRGLVIDGFGWVEADEILVTAGVDVANLAGQTSLLDGHDTSSTDSVLGAVTAARKETVQGLGEVVVLTCRVDEGERGDQVLAKLASGSLNAVSVGYCVDAYEVTTSDGAPPVARATTWQLREISLVAVGADPNARIRTADAGDKTQQPQPGQEAADTPAADDAELVALRDGITGLTTALEALAAKRTAAPKQDPAPGNEGGEGDDQAQQRQAEPELLRNQPVIDTAQVYANMRAARDGRVEDVRDASNVAAIRTLCANAGVPDLARGHIAIGSTLDEVRADIRAALLQREAAAPGVNGRGAVDEEVMPAARIDTDSIYQRLIDARLQQR